MATPIEAETVGQLLSAAAAAFGDAEAVVCDRDRLSFHDLDRQTRAVAARLRARGVGKGTRVGISFGNDAACVVALLAACRLGAIAVPLSTFARGRELTRLLRHGDISCLLTGRTVVGADQIARLATALPSLALANDGRLQLPEVPNLGWIEFIDPPSELPEWALSARDAPQVDDELLAALEAEVVGSDVAVMIHTSGTTADPKGVPHLHDTVCYRARYLAERMQFLPGDRTYVSHVLFWIGGLTMSLFTSIAAGATSVWCERFDPGEVLALIEREKVSRLVLYPHQTDLLLDHPHFADTDRSSLTVADKRLLVTETGGGIRTPEGYRMALGMTETFGPFSWGPGSDYEIASLADIQPDLQVRIVDTDNCPVADGEVGEVVLRGRCVTPGYHKRSRDVGFDDDGWFHTGDRGRRIDGVIHFLGRVSQMIKTAGANVAPAEVVEAMLALHGVQEAYVVPVDDPARGQLVAAAAVLASDSPLDASRIRAELKKDLSPYKVPALVAVFDSDEIPWTPTFKVRTGELAQQIVARTAAH